MSTTFRRTLAQLGVVAGSPAYRAVSATMRALADAPLPGPGDFETAFKPTKVHVRRVGGHNLLFYRFDEEQLDLMTARAQPPVPLDA